LLIYWLSQHTSASAAPAVLTQVRELGQHQFAPHGGTSAGQVVLEAAEPFVERDQPPVATALWRERSGWGMRTATSCASVIEIATRSKKVFLICIMRVKMRGV
jgi:hypothetical protein